MADTENSAGGESTHFGKLDDSNYASWKFYMEAELIQKGLWEVVQIAVDTEATDGSQRPEAEITADSRDREEEEGEEFEEDE